MILADHRQCALCSQLRILYGRRAGVRILVLSDSEHYLFITPSVYHFMLKSEAEGFKGFITEFPRLKYNFKDILSQHYNIDIYNSDIAKSTFLEPDLIPFD